jgi:GntR family transcriptional repressor for pyruvate dehydrogenase complex
MRETELIDPRLEELHRRRPQALAQLLEQDIADGTLAPGFRIGTKRDLQARYAVATTTVNEAVRVLENRGLVQVKPGPGGGVFVAQRSGWLVLSGLILGFQNSLTSVSEVLQVRDALEGLIATDAALHHRKSDLAELRRLLQVMEAQLPDPASYLRANWAFHRRTAELCVNEFARTLYEALLDFAEAELGKVQKDEHFDGRANLETHRELLDAIASRDPDRTLSAVARHNAESRVTRQIFA